MRKYYVMVNGSNFLIDVDGKERKHGFFKVVYLEAESPEDAEQLAVERIRGDAELRPLVRNLQSDPPVMDVDEIGEIDSFDDVEAMETGYLWYRDKRWWQFWR